MSVKVLAMEVVEQCRPTQINSFPDICFIDSLPFPLSVCLYSFDSLYKHTNIKTSYFFLFLQIFKTSQCFS
jgi:hypothetical protein